MHMYSCTFALHVGVFWAVFVYLYAKILYFCPLKGLEKSLRSNNHLLAKTWTMAHC